MDKLRFVCQMAMGLERESIPPAMQEAADEIRREFLIELREVPQNQREELVQKVIDWMDRDLSEFDAALDPAANGEKEGALTIPLEIYERAGFAFFLSGHNSSVMNEWFFEAYPDRMENHLRKKALKALEWQEDLRAEEMSEEQYDQYMAKRSELETSHNRMIDHFTKNPQDMKESGMEMDEVGTAMVTAQNTFLSSFIQDQELYSNSAIHLAELKNRSKDLDSLELPGNPATLISAIKEYISIVEQNQNRSPYEINKLTYTLKSETLVDLLRDYGKTLSQEQMLDLNTANALGKLGYLLDEVSPFYSDNVYREICFPLPPGFHRTSNPYFLVCDLKYGSIMRHFRPEIGGIWTEDYLIKKKLNDPISVTLSDGSQGEIYPEGPGFDLNRTLRDAVDGFVKDHPEFAPYLQWNEKKFQELSTDEGLLSFLKAYGPAMLLGDNRQYADATIREALEEFFLEVEPSIDEQIPGYENKMISLFDELYMAAQTQKELKTSRLVDENGKALPQTNTPAAMGEIADMLGIGDMVAPCELVPIMLDGKKKYVPFVDKVEGKTLNDGAASNIFLNKDHNPLTDPGAMKMLADLQVLDYICGVEFAQMENSLTFQTDPQQPDKITGIVRTRPGSAFGLIDATNPNHITRGMGQMSDMTMLDSLMVVNKSMAERVMKMEAGDLHKIMEPKGFTASQIDCACDRLRELQKKLAFPTRKIASGSIHIMEEEEWFQTDPKDMLRELVMSNNIKAKYATASDEQKKAYENGMYNPIEPENNSNIFRRVLFARDKAKGGVTMEKAVRGDTHPSLENVNGYKTKIKIEDSIEISLKDLWANVKHNSPWYQFGSKEFGAMKKALVDYQKTVAVLSKQWAAGRRKTEKDDLLLTQKMEVVQTAASTYLAMKDRDGVKGRSGLGRYGCALDVLNYAEKYQLAYTRRYAKRMDRPVVRSEVDQRIEYMMLFYGPKSIPEEYKPALYEGQGKDGKPAKPEEVKLLTEMAMPTGDLNARESDFAFCSYAMSFNPDLTGDVRLSIGEGNPGKITREENRAYNGTFFSYDLSVYPAKLGDKEVRVPRAQAGRYFGTIQKVRETAADAFAKAAEGKTAALVENLVKGMELYAKYSIENQPLPLEKKNMAEAKIMYGTLQFLEKNPNLLQAAMDGGLRKETIEGIKTVYASALLYDRKELADEMLRREEAGEFILSEKEFQTYQRDIKTWEVLSKEVARELDAIDKNPEHVAAYEKARKEMMDGMMNNPFKNGQPEAVMYQNSLSTRVNIEDARGKNLPGAMRAYAKDPAAYARRAEELVRTGQLEQMRPAQVQAAAGPTM